MPSGEKGRVVVAMSGGVDSSMAAAILKEEGYEVIGLTMHLWDVASNDPHEGHPTPGIKQNSGSCCSPDDLRDARRVADQIGIPHYVVNFRKAFAEEVVEYFVEEYLQARTPNPCVRCNERIKFGFLLRKAEELGARALATGHYARIILDPHRKRYLLLRGKDPRKDQSYFLFSLTQDQMAKGLFPLGEKSKVEIRQQAVKLGLRAAYKKESQEVCFIPDNDYRRFVEMRKGKEISRPGEIVDRQGKVLGHHRGLYSYTIGQRRGLRIAAPHPHYVLALEAENNRVVAGVKEELLVQGLVAKGLNWISFPGLEGEVEALVQIRYRHSGAEAVLSPIKAKDGEGKVRVIFKSPQKSVTPGQAAVFYRGDEVLGGGWIEKAL